MADCFSPLMRSRVMQAVKSSGNKSTEMRLIGLFRKYSIKGWRRGSKMFGRPDFIFPKQKAAVFANGCFWHGHTCHKGKRVPKTNHKYWLTKITTNKARDKKVRKVLLELKWRVLTVWECQFKNESRLRQVLAEFVKHNC